MIAPYRVPPPSCNRSRFALTQSTVIARGMESSSSSHSSLLDSSTVQLPPAEDKGLRGLFQVNKRESVHWQAKHSNKQMERLISRLTLCFESCAIIFQSCAPCTQENSALRDELTTSKSTILHLIHELNQAKGQHTRSSWSHSSGQMPGEVCMVPQ